MFEELEPVDWLCKHCGGSGHVLLLAGLCEQGVISELVRAHSLRCSGCSGDARVCVRLRRRGDCSDAEWERRKAEARNWAATARQKEPLPIVAGESTCSLRSLREHCSNEPNWSDWVRAARYLR